jgi:hypothetical protein
MIVRDTRRRIGASVLSDNLPLITEFRLHHQFLLTLPLFTHGIEFMHPLLCPGRLYSRESMQSHIVSGEAANADRKRINAPAGSACSTT